MTYSVRPNILEVEVDSKGLFVNIIGNFELFDPEINDGKSLGSHPVTVGLDYMNAKPKSKSFVKAADLTPAIAASWYEDILGPEKIEIYKKMLINAYENPPTENTFISFN